MRKKAELIGNDGTFRFKRCTRYWSLITTAALSFFFFFSFNYLCDFFSHLAKYSSCRISESSGMVIGYFSNTGNELHCLLWSFFLKSCPPQFLPSGFFSLFTHSHTCRLASVRPIGKWTDDSLRNWTADLGNTYFAAVLKLPLIRLILLLRWLSLVFNWLKALTVSSCCSLQDNVVVVSHKAPTC